MRTRFRLNLKATFFHNVTVLNGDNHFVMGLGEIGSKFVTWATMMIHEIQSQEMSSPMRDGG